MLCYPVFGDCKMQFFNAQDFIKNTVKIWAFNVYIYKSLIFPSRQAKLS